MECVNMKNSYKTREILSKYLEANSSMP